MEHRWVVGKFGSDDDPNYHQFLCYTFDGGETWEATSMFGQGKLSPEMTEHLGLRSSPNSVRTDAEQPVPNVNNP